ncbi:hypothetical protein [Rhodococcoides fascians]|uniref:hypothetical protein n=1 Tax=Rhodococcoides fascians TaxID=1828 RepID=UPI00068B55A5|nr:hypothetical protein [Rhodococcus fascians]
MSAWGAIIGGGATAIAATAGVVAATAAVSTLRATKRDSRDRTRPMVGAELVLGSNPADQNAYLVIRNYGPTVAYNVQVRFTPRIVPTGTRSGKASFVPTLLARYEKPIKTMMPGVQMRNAWWFDRRVESEDGKSVNDEPIPERATVTIRFSDRPNFWSKDAQRYTEEFVLDVATLRGELITTRTDDPHALQKRSTQAAEAIRVAVVSASDAVVKMEDYCKPDEVRKREAEEAAQSARVTGELISQVSPQSVTFLPPSGDGSPG